MTEEEVVEKLSQRVAEGRLEHILAVRDEAVRLAKRFDVDVDQARWAGLLHDCAKGLSNNILLQKAKEFGIVISDVYQDEPALLHAPVGAELAKREFEIEDEAVLQAIRVHTLGSADMSQLDKVVFLADHIEPNRECETVDRLREHIKRDTKGRTLDGAVRTACEDTIRYHLDLGESIHPQTIVTRNSLL
ncbi:MAG: bis(5'-nucleosyl)-tetraphosphatase (symmetrical) YqeK [Bacillota bacterium]